MPCATVNHDAHAGPIEVEYDTTGSPEDPPLLLVMGFTAQMTAWDGGFCRALADAGHHVIRFDNRDCGLATHLDGAPVDVAEVMAAALGGRPVPAVPYDLSDMAADAIGLLDHLGIERAHVLGASMGGMIAQTMAIEHPSRLRSMISVMSMPGDPTVGMPTPEAAAALLAPPADTREGVIEQSVASLVWSSKKHGDADKVRQRAADAYDRAFYPEGNVRQLAAIYASGDRSEALRSVSLPTLVIHGRDDTLIAPSGGVRTAELIPDANLLLLAHMGHDLPEPLWPVLVDAIASHTRAAEMAAEPATA
jgi:pimeloyl-ACP methyl ester carboxylesterase